MTGAADRELRAFIAPRDSVVSIADDTLESRTFERHVAVASGVGLLVTLASMVVLPGWLGATLAVGQGLVLCLRMLALRYSRWLTNLVLIAAVAGTIELIADVWLVSGTRTLIYAQGGPFVAASPAYMPVAWLGMICTGMALALSLRRRGVSVAAASGVVSVALGFYIAAYEWLASLAGWWRYEGCATLFGMVPIYIVVGEVLIALPIVFVSERARRIGHGAAVGLGVVLGFWILASYGFSHTLVTAF